MSQCWQLVAQQHHWTFHFIFATIMLVMVNLLVLFGNALVVIAVIIHRNLHTTTNYIIMSLAISDFLLGIAVLPFSISQEIFNAVWPFSVQWCQIWLATDVWLCTASIYNLVAISFDRFMAVRHPLKYKLISSEHMGKRLVALSWLVAFMICLPPLIAPFFTSNDIDENNMNKTQIQCQCTPMNNDSGYIIYSAMGSFFIPLLLIIILNVGIYSTTRKAALKRQNTLQSGVGQLVLSTRFTHAAGGSVINKLQAARNRADRKATEENGQTPETPRKKSSIMKYASKLRHGSDNSQKALLPNGNDKQQEFRRYKSSPVMKYATKFRPRSGTDESILSHTNGSETQQETPSQKIRHKRRDKNKVVRNEMKVAKTVGIVVGCFVSCWMPFSVIYVLQAYDFCTMATGCVPGFIFSIAFWLGYCNSAVNPIIYALFSRDLRRAFKNVFVKTASLCGYRPRTTNSTCTSVVICNVQKSTTRL